MDREWRGGESSRAGSERARVGGATGRTDVDREWRGGTSARTSTDRLDSGRYGGWSRDGRRTTRDFRDSFGRNDKNGSRGDWGRGDSGRGDWGRRDGHRGDGHRGDGHWGDGHHGDWKGSHYRPHGYRYGHYGRYGWDCGYRYGYDGWCGYGWYGGYGYRGCYAPVFPCFGPAYVPSYFYGFGYGLGSSVYVYDTPTYVETAPVIVEESIEYVPADPAPGVVEPQVTVPSAEAPASNVEQAGALLRQGDDAFAAGRYEEARRLYSEGVLLDESNGFAHVAYMLPHFVSGEYAAAADSLRRGLTLEPMLIDQPLSTRAMYAQSGTFDSHLAALRDHVGRSPQDMGALMLLAYMLYGEGDFTGATAALDDLVARDPSDTLVQVLRDGVNRARSGASISSQPTAPATQGNY